MSKSHLLASISLLLVSKSDFLVSILLFLVRKSDFLVSGITDQKVCLLVAFLLLDELDIHLIRIADHEMPAGA